MKKIIKIIFSLLFVFILFGCKKSDVNPDDVKIGTKYKIIFKYQDDNNKWQQFEKTYNHGEILKEPDSNFIGKKKGHKLTGWYLNSKLFQFNKKIDGDLELYAKYEKNKYKVRLDSKNGENSNEYIVEYNSILKPQNPKKDNHIFLGWYKDGDNTVYDLNNEPITEDLNLYAVWEKEKHLVRIAFKKDKDGNEIIKDVYVPHGEKLQQKDLVFDGKKYEIGSVNPDDKSKVLVNYFNRTDNEIFDFDTEIVNDKLVLEPFYDDIYLTYFLNIQGKKIEKNVKYNSNILYKQSDFEEIVNKFFDGVYDENNKLVDENYKLTEDGKNFFVKYYTYVPDDGFSYTLNSEKTGYILNKIKKDYAGDVIIPSTYKGLPVVEIAEGAFMNFGKIRLVRLNDNIEKIPNFAFYNCTSLERVILNYSKIKEIGDFAFRDCINLKTFDFEKTSLTNIGKYAFYNCTSITDVKFPDSLKNVYEKAFKNCENITNLNLGQITYLGDSAFYNLKNITKVNIPSTLKEINDSTFYNLYNLEEINLGDSLEKIGNYAFKNTYKLTNFDLPQSLKEIGRFSFSKNSNIKVLELPNVKGFLPNTFDNFQNLEEIKFYNLEFLFSNFITNSTNLKKITVNNYMVLSSDFGEFRGIDLSIKNKITVSKISFAFNKISMDKDCMVETVDKILEFKLFKNLTTKIYLSDNVRGIKNHIDHTKISYISVGRDFTDLEKLFIAKRDHSDNFDFDVSNNNNLVKEFLNEKYLLKNDRYYLYYLKDYTISKLELIDNISSNINLPIHKLLFTEITLNDVNDDFNFDSDFFNDYHKITNINLKKSSSVKFKKVNNIIYTNDEKMVSYIPHGLIVDTFKILKDQVSPNFLYHPSINDFSIESGNTFYELDNINKMILKKDGTLRYLARYYGTSDNILINSVDGLLKTALNNKHLKKVIFDKDDIKTLDGKIYLGENIGNLVFKKSLNSNSNNIEFRYLTNNQTTLKISILDDTKFINAMFPSTTTEVENSSMLEKIAPKQFMDSLIKEFDFSNISEIGQYAFKNCLNLEDLKNLNKDAYISEDAFYNCGKLKVAYIGKNTNKRAFFMSKNIEEITLDNKEIDFHYISSLKISKVYIKDSVEKIYHFSEARHMLTKNMQTELTLNSKIKDVKNLYNIFPNLEKLTIQSKLETSIVYDKFLKLKEVVLGKDAEFIDGIIDESFNYLKKIDKITLDPANQKFKVVDKFIISNDMKKLYRYIGDDTSALEIPNTIIEVAEGFAKNLTNLTSLKFTGENMLKPSYLPDSVSEIHIKSNDFSIFGYKNTKIKKVYISNLISLENIEKIGAEMSNVELIDVLDNTDYVVDDGIFYTKDLKKLVAYPSYLKHKVLKVKREVREISANFNGNLFLEEIYLPKELEKFSGTLKNCFNLVIYYEKNCNHCKNFDINVFNPTFLKIVFDKEFDY